MLKKDKIAKSGKIAWASEHFDSLQNFFSSGQKP